jgi:hypothetical protein
MTNLCTDEGMRLLRRPFDYLVRTIGVRTLVIAEGKKKLYGALGVSAL